MTMIATRPADATARRAAIRVPIAQPDDLYARALAKYARRTYGDVPDNVLVLLKHRPALKALLGFERRVAKFDRLDGNLKSLALTASAAMIGCSWCLDFGYYVAYTQGNDLAKLREVPRWRESGSFTPVERRVLEFSEAMTATPPTVTDDMVTALIRDLGDEAVIELTMMVAIENECSRFNSALGLTSQGFSAQCALPRE
jgi:alkylhydroperoxidase family enzyme